MTQQPTGGGTNSNWTKDEDYFVINLDPVAPKAELIRVEIESQPIPGEPICQSTAGGYPPVRPLYLNTSGKWQGAFDANVVDPIEKIVIHCNTYNGGNASRKMLVTQVTLVVSTVPTSTPVPTNTPTRTPTPQPTGTPIRPTNAPFPTPTPTTYTIAGQVTDEEGNPVEGVIVSVNRNGRTIGQSLTGSDGRYQMTGLTGGTYDVIPLLHSDYAFEPTERRVTLGPNAYQVNFQTIQPIKIEILDGAGNEVTALTSNVEGWPEPNPLTVKVTVSCPVGGDSCHSVFSVVLSSDNDTARFYVFNIDSPADTSCLANSYYPDNVSHNYYQSYCTRGSQSNLILVSGETRVIQWQVWIQPSEQAVLKANATWYGLSASDSVDIPLAQIHPVALFHGTTAANSQYFSEKLFEPLVITLEKMGYVYGQTVFIGTYYAIGDIKDAANEVAEQLIEWQTTASQIPWGNNLPTEEKGFFNLIGLSQGALVVRTYVQATDYPIDIHKLLLIGGPNKGTLSTYRIREGLQEDTAKYQAVLDHILPLWAYRCGHITWLHNIPATYPPSLNWYVSRKNLYDTLHDYNCGILFLPQTLPVPSPDSPAYLFNDFGSYPYGRQYNPLLEAKPINPQNDPWWSTTNPNPTTVYLDLNGREKLDVLRERIGGEQNLHILFNDGLESEQMYRVYPNTNIAPLWRNGLVLDSEEFLGNSDNSILKTSAMASDLWPNAHMHNLYVAEGGEDGREEKHANLAVYPESQVEIGKILTDFTPPFSTSLNSWTNVLQGDPASFVKGLFIVGMSPIEMLITDPIGRQLGYNPTNGQFFNEIPFGLYQHPESGTADLWVFDPLPGEYELTTFGTGTGNYTIIANFVDSTTTVPIFFKQQSIQAGTIHINTITVPNNSVDIPYPPDIYIGVDEEVFIDVPITFTAQIHDINPNENLSTHWDFGDGAQVANSITPTHIFSKAGRYTVTLTVTDTEGFVVNDILNIKAQKSITTYFEEYDGQIVIEAEKFTKYVQSYQSKWVTQTTITGYVGSSYLSASPDRGVLFTQTINSSEVQYTFKVTTTGIYTLWVRGYAPNASGDSIYVSLDKQPPVIITGFSPRTWSWANQDANSLNDSVVMIIMEPGLHTLRLWEREDGFRFDRIVLSKKGEIPVGNGPSESPIIENPY